VPGRTLIGVDSILSEIIGRGTSIPKDAGDKRKTDAQKKLRLVTLRKSQKYLGGGGQGGRRQRKGEILPKKKEGTHGERNAWRVSKERKATP